MITGITVQITSALVLWLKVAATAPLDLRNLKMACNGMGSAAWAHANAGTSPPATVAATAATHFVPHLLLCFIA
ncbi:hypothetical protein G6F40_014329 [Rhizopus arrhizus]|nr:hypothetical protein G6F40_014329 [Rhizopus arrhizus]